MNCHPTLGGVARNRLTRSSSGPGTMNFEIVNIMKPIEPTKLITSAHKPVTPLELRPDGCYCDKVKRRCGVCNRNAAYKAALRSVK